MCYIEDGAQEYLNKIDSTPSEAVKFTSCRCCERRMPEADTFNIGFDENYCIDCYHSGKVAEFIIENESPSDVESVMYKIDVAAFRLTLKQ